MPDLVREKLKRAASKKQSAPSATKQGSRNFTKDKGGKRGAKNHSFKASDGQGLTLVPMSAQLELFCPPYNPT